MLLRLGRLQRPRRLQGSLQLLLLQRERQQQLLVLQRERQQQLLLLQRERQQ